MMVVSIIVPVYNSSLYINKCYLSLINQSYRNLEIIFVNDGSTDNSLDVINSFSDKRVKVINQKNGGPLAARRNGFKNSSGDYICFIDSDDVIDKHFIMNLARTLEETKTNMCIGRIGVHTYYPIIKRITLLAKKKPKKIDLCKNREYIPTLSPGLVGKLFKRELLELPDVSFRANEDIVIMYPMYYKLKYISICNKAIYHYYLSKNSQYRTYLLGYKFDNLINTFEPLRLIYEEYNKMNKLEECFYEIEMLFIKNICERINNIIDSIDDRIYREKFICVILDFLEYFFPDWDVNPYYTNGYKLGEVSDRYRIRRAYSYINNIKRKKLYLEIDAIYDKYKNIEKMYEKTK